MIREHSMSTKDSSGDTDTPFIDLTICPAYDVAYKDDMVEHYGLNKKQYRAHGVYFNKTYNPSKDARLVFETITHNIDELIDRMIIATRNKERSRFILNFDESNFSKELDITTKYWNNFGRCYSIHPKDHIIKLGIITLDIVGLVDIYIYLGYPGQFMRTKTKVCIDYKYQLSW